MPRRQPLEKGAYVGVEGVVIAQRRFHQGLRQRRILPDDQPPGVLGGAVDRLLPGAVQVELEAGAGGDDAGDDEAEGCVSSVPDELGAGGSSLVTVTTGMVDVPATPEAEDDVSSAGPAGDAVRTLVPVPASVGGWLPHPATPAIINKAASPQEETRRAREWPPARPDQAGGGT